MAKLFTIGCSNQTVETFIDTLKKYQVDSVVDVRSTPYSKYTPQFNAEKLAVSLKKNGIFYIPFADEFGARRNESEAYVNNKVDFSKVISLPIFKSGVKRIENGLRKGHNIALMCTEKDPMDCHRFSLVARGIKEIAGIDSEHILISGETETTEQVNQRIIEKYDLGPTLFDSNPANAIDRAYAIIGKEIAYKVSDDKESYD